MPVLTKATTSAARKGAGDQRLRNAVNRDVVLMTMSTSRPPARALPEYMDRTPGTMFTQAAWPGVEQHPGQFAGDGGVRAGAQTTRKSL